MRDLLALSLDSAQLTALHRIFLDICTELDVGADEWRREEVATVVMDLARRGERDVSAIRQRTKLKLVNPRSPTLVSG
jgi:hypothetical protein